MTHDLTTLADLVERGQLSRSRIAREHGRDVAASVRLLLAERFNQRQAQRRAVPTDLVEPECDARLCRVCLACLDECDPDDLCERCRREAEAVDWIEQTQQTVEQLAAEHGWTIERTSHAAESRSRYLTLARGEREIIVRVSDHATMYCRESISLAMRPSGDDHTLDDLRRALV